MTIEELMKVRVQMLKLYEAGGLSAVKNLAKTANTSDNILLLTKPLYGIPSAGHSWATTLIRKLTGPELQMKRSCVDGCCYYKTNNALKTESGPYKNNLYRKRSLTNKGLQTMSTWQVPSGSHIAWMLCGLLNM